MAGDSSPKYQTRPLEIWGKIKEMRVNHYRDIATAKERGMVLATGSSGSPYPIVMGLGDDVMFFCGEPYAASVGANVDVSTDYMAVAESHGYARDMCGYLRNYLGSMFSDQYMFTGGKFPHPDFCFTANMCDAGHGKWYQRVGEHHGVPSLVVDVPVMMPGANLESKVEFYAQQMNDCIEQMAKITGRKYDDDKFIAASRNYFECESIWGEVCLLNAAIPAPLDLKTLLALMPLSMLFRNVPEGLSTLKELRDEVRYRIANQIAAISNERLRLTTDYQPAWHYLRMFRAFEEYGVVFVGIWIYIVNSGNFTMHPDGTLSPSLTPDQRGWPMKTRDDVMRAWGRYWLHHPMVVGLSDPKVRADQLYALNKHWKGDGIVMHYNRGCPYAMDFQPEIKTDLEARDVPVATYEGNFSDARDMDVNQVLKRLHAFIDLLEPAGVR